tara:strand:+ start:1119 stop:1847 length:729 start_codon:yes stop_codon:yes gene_type:complete
MSLIGRDIKWYNPFGPIIVHSTISEELHELLLSNADKLRDGTHPNNKNYNKETNDYRQRLAGCLSEEYSYEGIFTKPEDKIIVEELTWLASKYTEMAHQVGKIKERNIRKPEEIILQRPLWVNYMKAGEWNPSHNHSGEISCVTYLRVPQEIERENVTDEHTKSSNTPSAGRIEFQFGNVGMPFSSGGFIRTPKVRDIYFFPAALSHQVYPFKADTERVSVSCNFSDGPKARDTLKALGEQL